MLKSSKTIFLIDDDITALDITSFLIEEHGFIVERFADGMAALKQLQTRAPELFLVDLMMPKMDGVETIEKIRGFGFLGPIIAFTASDEPEFHRRAAEAGAGLVLTKPCRPELLLKHICSLISDA
jgi:CheY-like chemotaxis protein